MPLTQIINDLNQNAGAIQAASTILLVFITGFYAYQTRRTVQVMSAPDVKVTYGKGMRVIGDTTGQYKADIDYFNITATNTRIVPVYIEKAGIRVINSEKKWLLANNSFLATRVKVLKPESPRSEFMIEQNLIDFSKVWYIAIFDATGRKYKKYFHTFPTFWCVKEKLKYFFRQDKKQTV